jgi:hypothetical protein
MKAEGYRAALEHYLAGPHGHRWVILWPNGSYCAIPADHGAPQPEPNALILELPEEVTEDRAGAWRTACAAMVTPLTA